MNRLSFIYLGLVVLGLAACDKAATDPSLVGAGPDEMGRYPVLFVAGGFDAEVTTKAVTETTLSNLGSVRVSAYPTKSVSGVTGGFTNIEFSPSSGTYSGGQFWPAEDLEYVFYASNVEIGQDRCVTVTSDRDVVCAVNGTAGYKDVNQLAFQHLFARIGRCRITGPSGYTVSGLTVSITPKTGGRFSFVEGVDASYRMRTDGTGWSDVTVAPAGSTIATALGSNADNGLYLVPGTYTLTARYTLTRGAYSETLTKEKAVSIVGGKRNNINASLPAGSAADIEFSVNVVDWTDSDIDAEF